MCYFIKLGFSSKKMNVLNLSLSLERTFLKGLFFSFADHPPHHPGPALRPWRARSLGWLRAVTAGALLQALARPRGSHAAVSTAPCPHGEEVRNHLMAEAPRSHWDFPAQTLCFLWLTQPVNLKLDLLEVHGVDFCAGWTLKKLPSPRGMWYLQFWLPLVSHVGGDSTPRSLLHPPGLGR